MSRGFRDCSWLAGEAPPPSGAASPSAAETSALIQTLTHWAAEGRDEGDAVRAAYRLCDAAAPELLAARLLENAAPADLAEHLVTDADTLLFADFVEAAKAAAEKRAFLPVLCSGISTKFSSYLLSIPSLWQLCCHFHFYHAN